MDEDPIISDRVLRLPLPHGKDYFCTVLTYSISHGRLVLQLDKRGWRTKRTLYLIFLGVAYFEGPTKWNSADFYIASEAEFDAVLYRLPYNDQSHDILREKHRLFVVETSKGPVRIMAYQYVSRLKHDPNLSRNRAED